MTTRLLVVLIVLCALLPLRAFSGGDAFIAVAAEASDPGAQVSAVAARAPYFLLFDENGVFLAAHANPYREARGAAGRQAAEWLAETGISLVAAGEFGSKMHAALESKGIKALSLQGNAGEAVKQALAGQ
ncbi:NifB/NifX family molybdenum-iron cluster-binding protein [Geoalkalibacter halelectricus]|uniref:NifB/NifX family molybdenum-iron cluster-binding protein n=1 Tax=Geoalkalibacter halelectricus TaxID=2847045 RepID=UPI003D21DAAD